MIFIFKFSKLLPFSEFFESSFQKIIFWKHTSFEAISIISKYKLTSAQRQQARATKISRYCKCKYGVIFCKFWIFSKNICWNLAEVWQGVYRFWKCSIQNWQYVGEKIVYWVWSGSKLRKTWRSQRSLQNQHVFVLKSASIQPRTSPTLRPYIFIYFLIRRILK